jgi:tripartite-type tricarboxylate transporter receptor subunit TctC
MEEAMSRVLDEPEVRTRIESLGADIAASSAEDCAAFLQAEIEKWGRVIRDNNIRADAGAG